MEWFDALLSSDFMPHGNCYYWQPSLLWLHVGSDAAIGLSYFSIPIALYYFMRKRPGVNLDSVFIMFAAFIFLCGTTHLFQIVTVWQPYYYSEGVFKFATAGISGVTAVALWFLMPRALALPAPHELQEANERLHSAIQERQRVEAELRELNEQLEAKVRQRTEELEQFIFAASHDLQEPLRQLGSYAQFLEADLDEALPQRAEEDLKFIREGSNRMSVIVDSLLQLSRAGRQPLETTNVRLRDCVTTALADLEQTPGMAAAQVGQIPEVTVHADATLLTSVYQNLISNALKYTDGPAVIEFTAECGTEAATVGVRDRGIGIDPASAERIFDPFVRLHGYDETPGAGIGLSLVRRIIERHGGRVWVEPNDDGRGAHFRFTLPEPEVARHDTT